MAPALARGESSCICGVKNDAHAGESSFCLEKLRNLGIRLFTDDFCVDELRNPRGSHESIDLVQGQDIQNTFKRFNPRKAGAYTLMFHGRDFLAAVSSKALRSSISVSLIGFDDTEQLSAGIAFTTNRLWEPKQAAPGWIVAIS